MVRRQLLLLHVPIINLNVRKVHSGGPGPRVVRVCDVDAQTARCVTVAHSLLNPRSGPVCMASF